MRDLYTGQRFVTEIGLYDDRNRFMSPDLGRFLQPDPIGFKGDASNLYRYCGNDWANRSDPMGTSGGDDMQKQGLNDQNQTLLAKGDPFAAENEQISLQKDAHGVDVSSSQGAGLSSTDKIGLGIATGVMAPQQSIGNPVPALNTVSVTLYSATTYNDHLGAGINTAQASASGFGLLPPKTMGFYPSPNASNKDLVLGQSFPGHMEADTQHVIASHSIIVSPTQAYLGSRNQNQVSTQPGNYQLYGHGNANNCVTTVGNTLRAMAIPVPTHGSSSWVPSSFFDNMFGGH